jgi:polysaccharide pyruvyl transferase WcaK-like protein
MLYSLSRGRIYNRQEALVDRTDAMPTRVMHALDRKASHVLLRDAATGAHLESIGCTHTTVGGCPTIFLDRMVDRLPRIPESSRGAALISVRNPRLMSIPLRRQAQVQRDVVGMIDFLRLVGYEDIRLLCHDHRDIEFAASFTGVDFVYTGDVSTYLAMLRSCAINITYRLHAFLPCVSFGTPTIKISYDGR